MGTNRAEWHGGLEKRSARRFLNGRRQGNH
jgi:hypothetical protein